MEYWSIIKANEDNFLVLMWKDLQDILLSEKQAW